MGRRSRRPPSSSGQDLLPPRPRGGQRERTPEQQKSAFPIAIVNTTKRHNLTRGNSSLPTDEESNELFVEQPMRIRGLAGYQVKSVAAGERHSLACTSTGQVLVWGHASHGRLGFSEGALMMPTEDDGAAYQPLPRMLWLKDEEYSVESSRFSGNQVSADPFKITSSRFQPSEGAWDRGSYG